MTFFSLVILLASYAAVHSHGHGHHHYHHHHTEGRQLLQGNSAQATETNNEAPAKGCHSDEALGKEIQENPGIVEALDDAIFIAEKIMKLEKNEGARIAASDRFRIPVRLTSPNQILFHDKWWMLH